MTALADNAPGVAPLLWLVNLWAAGAIVVFMVVARCALTDTEEGRAVLLTGIGALALCVAGIARRLDWAVADHLVGAAYLVIATVFAHQTIAGLCCREKGCPMPDDKPMCSPLPGEDITDIDGPDQDVDQVPLIDTGEVR